MGETTGKRTSSHNPQNLSRKRSLHTQFTTLQNPRAVLIELMWMLDNKARIQCGEYDIMKHSLLVINNPEIGYTCYLYLNCEVAFSIEGR